MRRLRAFFAAAVATAQFAAIALAQGPTAARPLDAKEVFAASSPAVLRVRARAFRGEPESAGTGFFVSEDGLFVTNYHVIKDGYWVDVVDRTDAVFTVEGVRAASEVDDIVVLKLQAKRITWLKMGGSSVLEVGAKVFAIGNPQGLENSLSEGLVSGKRELEGDRLLIQTTAPISPGSSGGPLLDEQGRAIGVTTSFLANGQNLNFAVPTSVVQRLLEASKEVSPMETVLKKLGDLAKPIPAAKLETPAPKQSEYQASKWKAAQERRARDLPPRFRVRVNVSCDADAQRAILESKLSTSLRALTGVDTVDDDPDYEFQVVALGARGFRDEIVGVSASIVTVAVHDGFKAAGGKLLVTSTSIQQHKAVAWGSQRIAGGIEQVVSEFDTEVLEPARKFDAALRAWQKDKEKETP